MTTIDRSSFDTIRLADDEWGNDKMQEVASAYFNRFPECDFVIVYEHAGWFLGYRRDFCIWCTANDEGILDRSKPFPTKGSGHGWDRTKLTNQHKRYLAIEARKIKLEAKQQHSVDSNGWPTGKYERPFCQLIAAINNDPLRAWLSTN